MKKQQTEIPRSPIDLPVMTSGKYSIQHHYVKEADLVNAREALLTGKQPVKIRYDKPQKIHTLSHRDLGILMTDLPIELRQIEEAVRAAKPKGDILVGGLGLGIITLSITSWLDVESVTVVEISRDVIRLVKPNMPRMVKVVNMDIRKWVDRLGGWPYDMAFFDCWQGTSERTWWDEVMPLRRHVGKLYGLVENVWYWAEDQMLGQIKRGLTQSKPHWVTEFLPIPMSIQEADYFCAAIGLPEWEHRYGKAVDKGIENHLGRRKR